MKAFLFLASVTLTALSAVGQEPFVIEGHVPSLADRTPLILFQENGADTAYVSGGSFSFRIPLSEKGKVSLVIPPSKERPDRNLSLWAEPGQKAVIRGDNEAMQVWSVESGIPEQGEMEHYKQALKTEYEELYRNDLQQYRLRSADHLSRRASEQAREQLRRQERAIEYRMFDKELDLFTAAEPSACFLEELAGIGMMIFHYPESFAPLSARAIAQYNRLTDGQKASEQGRKLAGYLYPPASVELGDAMADAELPDPSGTMHRLSDYKGRYILLDFWASWCGPCRLAMPELAEASKRYADRLTIVGINLDARSDVWAKASEALGVTWVDLGAAQSGIEAKYKVSGIPHQVIISPEGIVLGVWTGYGKGSLERHLKEYLPGIQ